MSVSVSFLLDHDGDQQHREAQAGAAPTEGEPVADSSNVNEGTPEPAGEPAVEAGAAEPDAEPAAETAVEPAVEEGAPEPAAEEQAPAEEGEAEPGE